MCNSQEPCEVSQQVLKLHTVLVGWMVQDVFNLPSVERVELEGMLIASVCMLLEWTWRCCEIVSLKLRVVVEYLDMRVVRDGVCEGQWR